jgi:hypothetical protein
MLGRYYEGTVTQSAFVENHAYGGGAMQFAYGSPTLVECSLVGNTSDWYGGGIRTGETSLRLMSCTLALNSAALQGGGVSGASNTHFVLENSIIAFSTSGEGVHCHPSSSAELVCCDIYGNAGGDYFGCIADQLGQNGNISEDPLFCDPPAWDFTIRSDSPCAPDSNPECGLIGALPVGCEEPTAVEVTTWGRIKAQNR